MKNKLKVLITSLTVFLLTISLTGCNLFGSAVEISTGKLLSVDESGHFEEDIVYTSSSSKETYKADGTYEYVRYSLVDGKRVITAGDQGTYTWDADTMLLKISETKVYNSTTEVWDDLTAADYSIYAITTAFFDTQMTQSLVYNESTALWELTQIGYDENSVKDADLVVSLSINLENKTIKFTRVMSNYDTDGKITYAAKSIVEGAIDGAFPNGVEFKKGNQLTLNYVETSSVSQTYNTSTSNWDDAVDQTLDYDQISFIHMGDFLSLADFYSYRGL